jgi:ABC-type glutathione transport system ATPase component
MPTEHVLLQAQGFGLDYGPTPILADIELSLKAGEVLALIGASGSGKSAFLRAMLGLSPPAAQTRGVLRFADAHGVLSEARDVARLRGATLGLVPQDPQTALSAHRTVAQHLEEVWVARWQQRSPLPR